MQHCRPIDCLRNKCCFTPKMVDHFESPNGGILHPTLMGIGYHPGNTEFIAPHDDSQGGERHPLNTKLIYTLGEVGLQLDSRNGTSGFSPKQTIPLYVRTLTEFCCCDCYRNRTKCSMFHFQLSCQRHAVSANGPPSETSCQRDEVLATTKLFLGMSK
jgi:hypothetical protein